MNIIFCYLFLGQLLVRMLSMGTNGVSQPTANLEISAGIATLGPNNNFIQKSTKVPNAMMFNRLDIVLGARFAHSPILTVSTTCFLAEYTLESSSHFYENATLGQNNNFIQKFTKVPNATMFNRLGSCRICRK